MVSHLFFYQLVLLGLLWLCVMLHYAWPNECTGGDQKPSKPLPPPRKRSRDLKPFPGLTRTPPCAACAQAHAHGPQPPGCPPPRIVPTRGRPLQVDTSSHCCPQPPWAYRGGVGLGNMRANGHPNGGPWRQLYCSSCGGYALETHGTLFHCKRVAPDVLVWAVGALAEGLGIRAALSADQGTRSLAEYWASRIDETASDILGILNMGPAPAIGLIGYFRGLNAAFTGEAKLRNIGPSNDPHPADVVRGFLAAATVRQLEFSDAAAWADAIEAETLKDVTQIQLEGMNVNTAVAKRSAEMVSKAIVTQPMASLEMHAFGEIQTWRDHDEELVEQLRTTLTTANPLPVELTAGIYAAHLVAAATTTALRERANIALLFQRMLDLLKSMNDKNPSFGPLRVRHPGNMVRDRVYIPLRQPAEPVVSATQPRAVRKRA